MTMTKYDITPCPKPRQTRSDKWKKRPAVVRYRKFCDQIRAAGVQLHNGSMIFFRIPMPKSWSKKKRSEMAGKPHQQKPDLDNLIKALIDAVHAEDSHIWHLQCCMKIWSDEGSILIGGEE